MRMIKIKIKMEKKRLKENNLRKKRLKIHPLKPTHPLKPPVITRREAPAKTQMQMQMTTTTSQIILKMMLTKMTTKKKDNKAETGSDNGEGASNEKKTHRQKEGGYKQKDRE